MTSKRFPALAGLPRGIMGIVLVIEAQREIMRTIPVISVCLDSRNQRRREHILTNSQEWS